MMRSVPGVTGTFWALASLFASVLLPAMMRDFAVGPMNLIPAFSQAPEKVEFSARKP